MTGKPATIPVWRAVFHPLLNGADVLPGNRPTPDLVLEEEADPGFGGFDIDDHMAVLPAATRLTDELSVDVFRGLSDRLSVGDLRTANIRVYAEFPPEPVHQDLQVKLPHPADDGLAGFVVGMDPEGRVLIGEFS